MLSYKKSKSSNLLTNQRGLRIRHADKNHTTMNNMKRAFRVYKEGVTDNCVYILMIDLDPVKVQKKMDFYKYLGYKVEANTKTTAMLTGIYQW